MFQRFFGILALLLAICVPLDDAEARRRGIPIPIPGLRGETLVLVKELPRIPALLRKDGIYIDLGYKFNSASGGEWVGHIGSDSEYVSLPEPQLQMLMRVAGMKELPPVPDRPWSFSGIFWLVIIGLAALKFAANKFSGGKITTVRGAVMATTMATAKGIAGKQAEMPDNGADGPAYSRANAAIETALKLRQTAPTAAATGLGTAPQAQAATRASAGFTGASSSMTTRRPQRSAGSSQLAGPAMARNSFGRRA